MKLLAPILAVVLLAGAGVYDIVYSQKQQERRASGIDQARLDAIPMNFGDWKGEPQPFDAKALENSNANAFIHRRYTRSGPKPASVDVLILAGEPGEIGAHDPERCYGGTGYRSLAPRTKKTASDVGVSHSVWSETFGKDVPATAVEVCWGWTPDGHWHASDDARTDYALNPVLYKIYLSRTRSAVESDTDPSGELFAELAPLARIALAKP